MNMNDFIEVLQKKKIPYAIDGDKIFVDGNLDFRDTSITSLPDNLRVGGWLDLSGTSITSLPDNLSVGGWLNLRCTGISSLPESLSVDDSLSLVSTSITRLPKNLSIGGGLDLRYTGITSLPDNLSVGGCLYLLQTGISSLPYTLKVGGFLHLHHEKITNIAWRKFWRNGDYTVFSAWINGECCVVNNANIYTLAEFFSGAPAADVEQAARECVAELTQRWKGTGGSATWLNVFDCFPELDTPVFGGWFSDNGNFIWGCYVRTYSADAGGWVWAVAEDFGKGDWLFGEDNPVEFWMPLPGKPELVGGAA